jgi:hypothetical protein
VPLLVENPAADAQREKVVFQLRIETALDGFT